MDISPLVILTTKVTSELIDLVALESAPSILFHGYNDDDYFMDAVIIWHKFPISKL